MRKLKSFNQFLSAKFFVFFADPKSPIFPPPFQRATAIFHSPTLFSSDPLETAAAAVALLSSTESCHNEKFCPLNGFGSGREGEKSLF